MLFFCFLFFPFPQGQSALLFSKQSVACMCLRVCVWVVWASVVFHYMTSCECREGEEGEEEEEKHGGEDAEKKIEEGRAWSRAVSQDRSTGVWDETKSGDSIEIKLWGSQSRAEEKKRCQNVLTRPRFCKKHDRNETFFHSILSTSLCIKIHVWSENSWLSL